MSVKLRSTSPRMRYIDDWEFDLVKQLATVPYLPLFMEIAYLCRARFNEIADMQTDQVRDNGVFLKRSKGSNNELTLWSPRLKATIDAARALNANVTSRYLIHDKHGAKILYPAFRSAWRRLIHRALASGLSDRFTFHDIKAKGVSDHKSKASGHKFAAMQAVYDRKVREIKSTR